MGEPNAVLALMTALLNNPTRSNNRDGIASDSPPAAANVAASVALEWTFVFVCKALRPVHVGNALFCGF